MTQKLNLIFSVLIPVILVSMAIAVYEKGSLIGYDYKKWIFIGLIVGVIRVGIDAYQKKAKK